jgi:transcription elongation factor Elf1
MGKRKSRTVAKAALAPKVQKVFDCPFCSHNEAIEVKMERTKNKGTLACRICGASFLKSPLKSLTREVDIYMEWIDLCEEMNNPESKKRDQNVLGLVAEKPKVTSPKLRRHFDVEDDSEDDDVIRGAFEESDEEI